MALTVMAVLAALSWRGVDGMLRAREATETSIARSSRLNTVMTQLRQDLEALVDPVRATPGVLEFDRRSLRLVRADGQSLRVVVWAVHEGVWMRWASPPVTRIGELQEQWFRSLQLLGNEPEQVRLLENVEDVTAVCRSSDGARHNCQSTGDVVGGNQAGGQGAGQPPQQPQRTAAPRALEITITVGGLKLERLILTAMQG